MAQITVVQDANTKLYVLIRPKPAGPWFVGLPRGGFSNYPEIVGHAYGIPHILTNAREMTLLAGGPKPVIYVQAYPKKLARLNEIGITIVGHDRFVIHVRDIVAVSMY